MYSNALALSGVAIRPNNKYVEYYDVGNFHATIINTQKTIYYGIDSALIGL